MTLKKILLKKSERGRKIYMKAISHMNFFAKILVGVLFFLLIVQTIPAQQKAKYYEAYKTLIPIKVDGRLDDSAWTNAGFINDFVINKDNSQSPYKTEVKILYDDEYVYFAFRSFDENIWSTKTKRDDHLWEEEVVEVFIQPNRNEESYIELEVNPLGALLDAYQVDSTNHLPYEEWNIQNLKWAVQVKGTVDGETGDTSWTCELAFPLNAVTVQGSLKAGDTWYINLYRAELKPDFQLISWSPTYRNDFHMPSHFRKLIFTGKESY